MRVTGSPFKIDWNSLADVITYAEKLGKGMTVYRMDGRDSFNIRHTERIPEIEGIVTVYHQT